MTTRIALAAPAHLPLAAEAVRDALASGRIVAFPTETYYGLGVNPRDRAATERVYRLKGRSHDKALPVVAGSLRQAEELVAVAEPWRSRLASAWPAAVTVVLPSRIETMAGVAGTLAVRVPAHALLRALLMRVGPLTATSANSAGAPAAATPDEVESLLGGGVGLILDGGRTPGGLASTLVDASGAMPRLLRAGPWTPPPEWGLKTV